MSTEYYGNITPSYSFLLFPLIWLLTPGQQACDGPSQDRWKNIKDDLTDGHICILHSKIKGRYRIAEKIALRPPAEKKRSPGGCRVRDVVRGDIVYGRMSELPAGFQLIVQSDVQICEKTYLDAEAAGLTTRIVMLGMTASR